MQKVERFCQHKDKLIISSLKNQRAFAIVNKLGTKFISKSFLLLSHLITNHSYNNLKRYIKFSKSKPYKVNLGYQIYLGLKVSKKLGNAVQRNKIKRRIRACIREVILESDNHNMFSRAYVIIPYKHFLDVPYQNFKLEMLHFFQKLT